MRVFIIASLLFALALPQPAQAFSLKTPIKKAGHALKVAAKKVGEVGLYGVVIIAAIEFCAHGGCN